MGRAASLAQGRDTILTGQFAALDAQRRQDVERLTISEAEQRTMLSERPAAIRAAVAADPAYAAPDDGLLARLRALKALTADPWVGAVVLLLEVFFAGIELAAVFAKLLSFVPSTYATRLAREDRIRQVTTAREIAAVLDGPENSMTNFDRSIQNEGSGILSADSVPALDHQLSFPNMAPATAQEPDRDRVQSVGSSPTDSHWTLGLEEAAPLKEVGVKPSTNASADEPPRRRRGRPPKER